MTNLEIQNAYMGSDQVDKIYLGSEEVWAQPEPDYSAMPLTFEILSDGVIKWVANGSSPESKPLEYSKNGGNHVAIFSNTGSSAPSIPVQAGDIVQFWGDNITYAKSTTVYSTFRSSTCGFKLKGNIMSLIDSTGFTTATTLAGNYTFFSLFGRITGLTDASNLVLPATTVTSNCYAYMFQGCRSLTTAPELPATTLAQSCYNGMFQECRSLTTAPELPATTLAQSCYNGMFYGCTSLTTAPELPATTLAQSCYKYMFTECQYLNYVKCLATDMTASGCLSDWLIGGSSTGTFVKHPNATWPSGRDGIPIGWTVIDA